MNRLSKMAYTDACVPLMSAKNIALHQVNIALMTFESSHSILGEEHIPRFVNALLAFQHWIEAQPVTDACFYHLFALHQRILNVWLKLNHRFAFDLQSHVKPTNTQSGASQ